MVILMLPSNTSEPNVLQSHLRHFPFQIYTPSLRHTYNKPSNENERRDKRNLSLKNAIISSTQRNSALSFLVAKAK